MLTLATTDTQLKCKLFGFKIPTNGTDMDFQKLKALTFSNLKRRNLPVLFFSVSHPFYNSIDMTETFKNIVDF